MNASENWGVLTAEQVLSNDSRERASIAAVKGRDDLDSIVAGVTEQVRQAYLFSNRNLGPDGTIPTGLMERAKAIALWRFVSEDVPKNEGVQTEARRKGFEEAQTYITQIAQAQIGKVSAPSVGQRERYFGRAAEDGL